MLLQAAAARLGVPIAELSTEPGRVVHEASGASIGYGELAVQALDLPSPDPASVTLKDPAQFRWIGKSIPRLDIHDKSTGKALYAIDMRVDGMLHAAVQHAPRYGLAAGAIRNEEQLKAMPGVHSVHRLPGAIAVVAERWWNAKRAAEAALVDWQEPADKTSIRYMPADFATDAFRDQLAARMQEGETAETKGNPAAAFDNATKQIEATYHSQYVVHGQLEPPSALARFNDDGTLELWFPNQAPDMFLTDAAKRTGLDPAKITIHSPLLGGFFGRHFIYPDASPYPQAILLAKATGRPVKLIWTREEEFLRDTHRPLAVVRFRGALDASGMPMAIEAISSTEGPTEGIANQRGKELDPTALEGSPTILCDPPSADRAGFRQAIGDDRLLALGRQLDERLLLRVLPRRTGRCRRAGPTGAAPASAARQCAADHAAQGRGRALRRLEAGALFGPGRQPPSTRHRHGLALRYRDRCRRRGLDRRRAGACPRTVAGNRSWEHRQSGRHRCAGKRRGGARHLAGPARRSHISGRYAGRAQL
jgi:hypothetical protein